MTFFLTAELCTAFSLNLSLSKYEDVYLNRWKLEIPRRENLVAFRGVCTLGLVANSADFLKFPLRATAPSLSQPRAVNLGGEYRNQ